VIALPAILPMRLAVYSIARTYGTLYINKYDFANPGRPRPAEGAGRVVYFNSLSG
jgi:hypothetical protein